MDLRELHYLVVIAEEKSISKAAARLYMAQSSLSQFLTTYETHLGYPLFARTSGGVRPTEAGEKILRFAAKTLSEYHRVRDEMQDISQLKGGTVIIGISSFRGSYLMPPVLSAFHKKYPAVHVRIVEKDSLALEQMLLRGEIDLALLALPEKQSRIETEFLMKDEICLIAHRDHPVMQIAEKLPEGSRFPYRLDIRKAISYEFVLSGSHNILGREARRIFQKHSLKPKAYNDDLTALFAAAMGAGGLGLAFTYYSSRHYFQNAVLLSLGSDSISIQLVTAMPPGRYHSKAAQALNNVVLEVWGNKGRT